MKMDCSFELLSSMSPKIPKHVVKSKSQKAPTKLALRKHFRKSLVFDNMPHTDKNKFVVDSASSECTESSKSKVKDITVIELSSDEEYEAPKIEKKPISRQVLTESKHAAIENWLTEVECNKDTDESSNVSAFSEISAIHSDKSALLHNLGSKGVFVGNSTFIGEAPRKRFDELFLNNAKAPQVINDSFENNLEDKENHEFKKCGTKNNSKSKEKMRNCKKTEDSDYSSSNESFLDSLYGDMWRANKDKILPKSEPRQKKKIVSKPTCQTERKSVTHKNPYTDTELKKSNNLLRTLHAGRMKAALESPWVLKLQSLCDPETPSDDDNDIRVKRLGIRLFNSDSEDETTSNHDTCAKTDLKNSVARSKDVFRKTSQEDKACSKSISKKYSIREEENMREAVPTKFENPCQDQNVPAKNSSLEMSSFSDRINRILDKYYVAKPPGDEADINLSPRISAKQKIDSNFPQHISTNKRKDDTSTKKAKARSKESLETPKAKVPAEEKFKKKTRERNWRPKSPSSTSSESVSNVKKDKKQNKILETNTKRGATSTKKKLERSSSSSELNDVTIANIKKTASRETDKKLSFLASLNGCVPAWQCENSARVFRDTFKTTKEALAKKLFDLYNETIFEGNIHEETPLQWNVRMRGTAGFCYCQKITRSTGIIERKVRIVLSTKILDSADRLRDTLVHEMCHAATWIVNKVSDGHGPYWKSWAYKAMKTHPELPTIKRCHDYAINTKYTYKCTGCGYSIGRHSKSLDVERKRCGHCLSKFEVLINKVSKNGEVKSMPSTPKRAATGFALFVKENYASVKKPHLNHADVMKKLGQNFSEMNVKM